MSDVNMNSILDSVRKQIASDDYFDPDLILHINSVFSILTQMGVGPKDGFTISDNTTEWSEFTSDDKILNMVKTYMGLRVKLVFDISTASSYLIEQWRKECDEFEWRMNSYCDYNKKEEA